MSKTKLESLRKRVTPRNARWDYQDREVWQIVERAYQEMERQDKFLSECLGHLTHFERELVRAAFAVGRTSYAQECEEDVEIMRELGLAA